MGIIKKFLNQTRKPEGALGKMMVNGMNSGHAKLADWGFTHLPELIVMRAADLGCGGGRNVHVLLEKYPEAHVTGLDYSDLSVEKTKNYNREAVTAGRCDVRQGDVSELNLEAESYDLVTAFETIYFWPGLERCFSQVAKILKPGGLFMICNESDGKDVSSQKYEKIIDGMKIYTAEDIEAALKEAGFTAISQDHHPSEPWITLLAEREV